MIDPDNPVTLETWRASFADESGGRFATLVHADVILVGSVLVGSVLVGGGVVGFRIGVAHVVLMPVKPRTVDAAVPRRYRRCGCRARR